MQEELDPRFHISLRAATSASGTIRLEIAAGSVTPGATQDRDRDAIAAQAYRIELAPQVRSSSWTISSRHHENATSQINNLLYERAASARYATMFCSYFDAESGNLKYINAGHCPPLLFKAALPDTMLRLIEGGPVLGLLAGARFQQSSIALDPGDVLLLYSDGIVEARNSHDEEFGEERIAAIVRDSSGQTAGQIRNRILASIEAFAGKTPPDDDRTLLVIVYMWDRRSHSVVCLAGANQAA